MAVVTLGVASASPSPLDASTAGSKHNRFRMSRGKATTRHSDEELLAMIGEGDADAFRLLVERHVDRAYAVAFRFLRNAADAEDVVRDTLLKVWTSGGKWDSGRARFSTWLYRVVTNRCIDLKRRPTNEAIDTVPEPQATTPDQVDSLMRGEVSSQLEQAIARLPEQQRIALTFSYYENLSNAEIAEVMETTVMAVESLLKRARQALRAQLRKDGPDMLNSLKND